MDWLAGAIESPADSTPDFKPRALSTPTIVCWWSHSPPGFWLLTVGMAVSRPSIRGEGWECPCDPTQSAQLRGPTMEYLEKVRSQFLALRHLYDFVRQITIFYDLRQGG